ncbi:MAG: hypothetical protein ABIP03_00415 [Aquihabitans sp.]
MPRASGPHLVVRHYFGCVSDETRELAGEGGRGGVQSPPVAPEQRGIASARLLSDLDGEVLVEVVMIYFEDVATRAVTTGPGADCMCRAIGTSVGWMVRTSD